MIQEVSTIFSITIPNLFYSLHIDPYEIYIQTTTICKNHLIN